MRAVAVGGDGEDDFSEEDFPVEDLTDLTVEDSTDLEDLEDGFQGEEDPPVWPRRKPGHPHHSQG